MRVSRLAIIILFALLMTMPMAQAQDELESVDFALTFVPNIQFSPVYVAIEKGYFVDEGIEVELDYIDENVIVDLIAADELGFGIVSGEQVIMARSGGRPVVYFYEWFQQYPIGVVIPDTTEAETFSDLAGLTVGVPGRFGATYSGLNALLAANDMTEDDILLETIGFVAPDIVCAGRVDASVIYVNNEPLQIQQRADAGACGDITSVRVLPVASAIDLVSNGLLTSETLIAENPELVEAIARAFHRGLRDVILNPAEAYLLSAPYIETLPLSDELRSSLENGAEAMAMFMETEPDPELLIESRETLINVLSESFDPETLIQLDVLLTTIPLWEAETLGFTDPESWVNTLDLVIEMGNLQGEIVLEDAYTNDFVPTADSE